MNSEHKTQYSNPETQNPDSERETRNAELSLAKRILVIGSCGAGKSTFARELHRLTGLPLIPLDRHYWLPGWVEPSKHDWEKTVVDLIAGEKWIIDGNYSSSLEMRMKRADTVIWLDLPRLLCVYRVLKRITFFKRKGRPDMAEGCDERFDWEFIKYVWNFRRDKNPSIKERLAGMNDGTMLVKFSSSKEVRQYLMAGEINSTNSG